MHIPLARDPAPTNLESHLPTRKPRRAAWVLGSATFLSLMIAVQVIVLADDPPQQPVQPVSPEQVPASGTFWSLTFNQPPLPYLPWAGVDVYALEDGSFLYDDRALVISEASMMTGTEGGLLGGEMMSMSGPPSPPGGGGGSGGGGGGTTNPPPYSVAGLKLTIPVLTNGYVYTTIFEHDPARPYDLYYKTNLNLTNWTLGLSAMAGETNYWLLNTFTNDLFLRVAGGLDSDGDGMPDNWEALYGLNPHSAADASQDPDGDGLTNLQEFQQGGNPTSSPAFQVLITSPRVLLP